MEIPNTILGFILAGVSGTLGVMLKAWVDNHRVDAVDGPKAASEAWKVVFESVQQQVTGLMERVAKLEVALERKDQAIDQRDGVIRRLRTYIAILQTLLHQHQIEVPMATEEVDFYTDIAPERRTPVAALSVLDKSKSEEDKVFQVEGLEPHGH